MRCATTAIVQEIGAIGIVKPPSFHYFDLPEKKEKLAMYAPHQGSSLFGVAGKRRSRVVSNPVNDIIL